MRPRILLLFAALATGVSVGLSHCGGSGGGLGLAILSLGGTALAPNGSVAMLKGRPSASEWLASLAFERASADVVGLQPVPNALVELVQIDATGAQVGQPIATAQSDANGRFTLQTSVQPAPNLVVLVSNATGTKVMRRFYTDSAASVTVDPVAEFVTRTVLQAVTANPSGFTLISPLALQAIIDTARQANVTVGADIDSTIARVNAAIGPVVTRAAQAAVSGSSPVALSGAFALGQLSWGYSELGGGSVEGLSVTPDSVEIHISGETATATFTTGQLSATSIENGTDVTWSEVGVPVRGSFTPRGCTNPVSIVLGQVPRNDFAFGNFQNAPVAFTFQHTELAGGLVAIAVSGSPAVLAIEDRTGSVFAFSNQQPGQTSSRFGLGLKRGSNMTAAMFNGPYHVIQVDSRVSSSAGTHSPTGLGFTNSGNPVPNEALNERFSSSSGFVNADGVSSVNFGLTEVDISDSMSEGESQNQFSATFSCGTGGGAFESFPPQSPVPSTSTTSVNGPASFAVASDGTLTISPGAGAPISGVLGANGSYVMIQSGTLSTASADESLIVMVKASTSASLSSLSGAYNVVYAALSNPGSSEVDTGSLVLTFDGAGNVSTPAVVASHLIRRVSTATGTLQLGFSPGATSGGSVSGIALSKFAIDAATSNGGGGSSTYTVQADGTVNIPALGAGYLSADSNVLILVPGGGGSTQAGLAVMLKVP